MKLSAFLRSSVMMFIFVLMSFIEIQAQTTSFTYHGRLTDASMPAANGTYDFEFALFSADSSGTQISTTQSISGVTVDNGVFNIQLDFGSASFSGADRYLEIRVKKPADSNYTTLSPRQRLSSTPYAIRAAFSGLADNANNLGGVAANQYVNTNDSRLSDSRNPLAGSSNYVQNTSTTQAGVNFNIGGTGSANAFNAKTHFSLNNQRVLSFDPATSLFVGFNTGTVNTGSDNSFFGFNAGNRNTRGSNNSFFGVNAGFGNTSGLYNSFFGADTGWNNTTGNLNSFFGSGAGASNVTGGGNSFFGVDSGLLNYTGTENSFVGWSAGFRNTIGGSNSFFGVRAGENNIDGGFNSFVGNLAGRNSVSGSNNTFVGSNAGATNTTGNKNTTLGFNANVGSSNLTFATAVGAEAVVSTSNTVVLGRTVDTVVAPNLLQVNALGTDGSTPLCRNSLNQISTCTAANLTENSLVEQNIVTAKAFDEQKAQIQTQQTQIERQQQQIDALIKLVCSQNTKAEVCKQEK